MERLPWIYRIGLFLGLALVINYSIDNLIYNYVVSHSSTPQLMMYIHLLKGFFLIAGIGVFAYLQYKSSINTYKNIQNNYQVLFKSNPTPTIVYNTLIGNITDVNTSACMLYGYTEDELIGLNIKELEMEMEDSMLEDIQNLMHSEDIAVHKAKNGDLKVVKLASDVKAIDRQITTTLSVIDMTTFAHQEEKIQELYDTLHRKNIYLESLLNMQSTVMIFRTDMEGKIIYTNDVFKKLINSKLNGDQMGHFFRLVDKENVEQLKRMIVSLTSGEIQNANHVLKISIDPDEHRYFSFEFIMIKDSNGNPIEVQGIGKDITDRVKYEKNIESQNKTMKRIAWMQSHDLRAPLTRILSAISLYKESPVSIHPDALFEAIQESAKKMDRVVHKIVRTSENVKEIKGQEKNPLANGLSKQKNGNGVKKNGATKSPSSKALHLATSENGSPKSK